MATTRWVSIVEVVIHPDKALSASSSSEYGFFFE
jgi:hypothetical protein